MIVNGGDLMLFLGQNTLAFSTSHKLSINVETVENTSKDNGGGKWKSSTAKKMSWNLSSENLFIEKGESGKKQNGFCDLFDLMVARQPISVKFAPASNAGEEVTEIPEMGWTADSTGTYSGKVIITALEANAPNGDNATYTVSMEGVGALQHSAKE